MWLELAAAIAASALFVYVPGFIMLCSIRASRTVSVIAAPAVALAEYSLLGIVYGWLGLSVPWWVIAGSALGVGVVCWVVSLGVRRAVRSGEGETCPRLAALALFSERDLGARRPFSLPVWAVFAAVTLLGIVLGTAFFTARLGDPNAFVQEYDNIHHLSSIRVFMETGKWSSLNSTLYAAPFDDAYAPFGTAGAFYPSAWHCVCALVASSLGVSVPCSVNAVNFAFAFVVYPTSASLFLLEVFRGRPEIGLLGGVASLSIVAFPWMFLGFGPLYPNLTANAILFIPAFAFVAVFSEGSSRARRASAACVFALGLVAVVFAQTNGVFSLAVLLGPFCVWRAASAVLHLRLRGRMRIMLSVVTGAFVAAAIVGIWLALYHAPFLHGLVSNNWAAVRSTEATVKLALLLSYGDSAPSPPHYAIGVLVVVGFVIAIARRKYWWLAFAYAFSFVAFVIDASMEGELKHVLTGFWYTDPRRVMALMAMLAVPLVGLALGDASRVAMRFVGFLRARTGENRSCDLRRKAKEGWIGAAVPVALAVVLVAFSVAIPLPGVSGAMAQPPLQIVAKWAFNMSRWDDDSRLVLTREERDFSLRAMEEIPEGEAVINSPNDGSCFLYGAYGLKTVYRFASGYGSGEREDSVLVRTSLNEISSREDVRKAVRDMGVKYVLMLDQGEPRGEERRHLFSYGLEDWSGVDGITDDTPGFSVVMAEGDMRLYRIDAVS